jgi:hypothetical protein
MISFLRMALPTFSKDLSLIAEKRENEIYECELVL